MPDPRLAASPFAGWTAAPLAGDASARRYARLTGPEGASAILMDATAESTAATTAFVTLARLLRDHGLCAPDILWRHPAQALLVTEDLGRWHIAAWLAQRPAEDKTLYAAAVDLLPAVQAVPAPPGLVTFTPAHAAGLIAPLFDHYLTALPATLAAETTGLLHEALATLPAARERLALRDFHAENLIWRPDRSGTDRIGLLDFQDAVLAPPEYDLVSLLGDARRDVPAALVRAMTDRFARNSGQDRALVAQSCAVWGVQRNLRILGIFARLAHQAGKPRYLALIPRVRSRIAADLEHPALARLAPVLDRALATAGAPA